VGCARTGSYPVQRALISATIRAVRKGGPGGGAGDTRPVQTFPADKPAVQASTSGLPVPPPGESAAPSRSGLRRLPIRQPRPAALAPTRPADQASSACSPSHSPPLRLIRSAAEPAARTGTAVGRGRRPRQRAGPGTVPPAARDLHRKAGSGNCSPPTNWVRTNCTDIATAQDLLGDTSWGASGCPGKYSWISNRKDNTEQPRRARLIGLQRTLNSAAPRQR
jgi:hypothetical protein